jgi:hypothetical protein
LLLLIVASLSVQSAVTAKGPPKIYVKSLYTLNRYGYAAINETVRIANNGTTPIPVPSLIIGFGNLSSKVVATSLTPSNFSLGTPLSMGGPFTVTNGGSVQVAKNTSFVLSALLSGVVSNAKNGSLEALTLSSPSISSRVDRLINVVQMPLSTSFKSSPPGLTANLLGSNNTYSSTQSGVVPQSATTSVRAIAKSGIEDFNPLHIYNAQRSITPGADGTPMVTDQIQFENLGTIPLTQLYVSLLALPNTKVTIITATAAQPVLLPPFAMSLPSGAINLAAFAVGYPTYGVQAKTNFTLTYQYPLGSSYYSVSRGQVTVNIPESPPVKAFVDRYTISLSLPQGAREVQGGPSALTNVTPWQLGKATLAYSLSASWFLQSGIPLASVVFVLVLIGLFASRTTTADAEAEGEEEEEESSTEQAFNMIKAFDDKTDLINGLWAEIESRDPNEMDKEYFDELRGRLDTFRSRALQRLNEVKQKSTSQKFFDVVNQIQVTEREVDRAAKDKLNLHQQYHLRQMRKEVYDRLLPQYTKRLEKAMNQLSDELHTVQREAKLL